MSRGPTVANSALEIPAGGLALIDDSGPERTSLGTWILKDPEKVMVAATPEAVAETLAEVDQTRADLHWVALLDYELRFWFEPKLFHLRDFQHPPLTIISFRSLPKSQARAGTTDLRMTNDFCIYRRAVRRILQHIGAGDCYQVNFTWSLDFRYFGSPLVTSSSTADPPRSVRSARRPLPALPFTRTFSRTAGSSAAGASDERHYPKDG